MNFALPKDCEARDCPLCGGPNDCQLFTLAVYKGPCWCTKVKIPDELIAKVPAQLKDKSCICKRCVAEFHRENKTGAPKILPGDFYFESGLMVFNAAYHLRRGYCCQSGCRHRPYRATTPPRAS